MSRNKQKTKHENQKAFAPGRGRKLSLAKLILYVIIAAAVCYIAAALISTAWNNTITVAEYDLTADDLPGGLRIVMISDLHRKKFDETNQKLVNMTAEQKPDLIAVNGDMLERDYTDDELEALASLLERLNKIAPVYFTAGNHDYCAFFTVIRQIAGNYLAGIEKSDALLRLEQTGAIFLENEYRDVEINGQKLRIGGFYGHATRMDYDTDDTWAERRDFLTEFCNTDSYKLMLSHRPDSFIHCTEKDDWDIDLILCGHTHNGMVSLPFGLGAIWTSEGFFPEHDRGEFTIGSHSKMLIFAGLAGGKNVPRVFNPPELGLIVIGQK